VGKVVASLGREAGEIAYTVYHARRSFLDARPETVLAFTRAIYKGQKWVDLHTAAEIAEVVKGFFPEMDDETLVTALERYKSQDSWRHTPIISRSAFQRLLDVMIQAGELAEPVPSRGRGGVVPVGGGIWHTPPPAVGGRPRRVPVVEVTGVRHRYHSPEGETLALDGVDLTVEEGEFVSIVGPSGCGKSTLLSL